jgi:NADH-quinone oxidoreductase subunit L
MELLVYIALFSPLLGAIIAGAFGTKPKITALGVINSALLGASLVSTLILFVFVVQGYKFETVLFEWIASGGLYIPFGFVVDQVSGTMMLVVTLVSTFVHIYSIGYMEHDKGYNRYFSYLSAFVFSMMVLVMSDNFAGLFIGWEGVGLCSWLLIGHWYDKDSASWAANEAFIMNRVADLGMLFGMFIIYWTFGSLQYNEVFAQVDGTNGYVLTLIAIFLFIGAMGKSAQFPFHTWLADAMEGPTPVSALIHAATMVTAGVYLVIRSFEIFSLTPEVSMFIAYLGAFVAIFAASMALVNDDLKRIIAYSTLSQLGYMFVAAGIGAYWIALFHLMTHAFFKSLLFLGAGNVMHAMHDKLDIKKMGQLYKPMRWTAILMIIASLALAGIYPFAGFFSKDLILEEAFTGSHFILWVVLWLAAGMTAFYSFRLIMLVFFGGKNHDDHPHEAHNYMLWAMAPLGVLAIIAGFFQHTFFEYVQKVLPGNHNMIDSTTFAVLVALALTMGIGGTLLAIYKYKKPYNNDKPRGFLYRLLKNQYYIPSFYEETITKPYFRLSKFAWNIDLKIVDATVDFIATFIYKSGDKARVMQSGNLSLMLRWMALGLIFILILAYTFR